MKKGRYSRLTAVYARFEKDELDEFEKENGELRLSDTFLRRVDGIESSFEKTKPLKFYKQTYFKLAGILACMAVMLVVHFNGEEEYRVYDKGTVYVSDTGVKAYAHAEDAFVKVVMRIEYKADDGSVKNAEHISYDYEKVSVNYIGETGSKILFVESECEIEFPTETVNYYSFVD